MKCRKIGGSGVRLDRKVAGNQLPAEARVWDVEEEEEATPGALADTLQ